MENIQISYPSYFLFIILLIALLFALGLYFRDRKMKETKKWLPLALGFLRYFSIFGLLFLLLTPLFKNLLTEKQKPIVVVANDISKSVIESTEFNNLDSLQLKKQNFISNLSEDFDIVEIEFAERMSFNNQDSINTESSNISAPLEYISESYEDQNLGAVVLISDGIFNEGKNPLYADVRIASPLYTVPLGDTSIRTDLMIRNVLHNRLAYLDDQFLIEADIQAYNSNGKRTALNLYKIVNGKAQLMESQQITIDKDRFFKSFQFEVKADQVGNVKYQLSLGRIDNEISYQNNSRNLYIEVLDARQKILILAEAPHPDIKALKAIISNNKNYEFELFYANENPGLLANYDLVIFHNLPSQKNPVKNIVDQVNTIKKPVIYFAGSSSDIKRFNEIQDVLKIEGGKPNLNNVTPVLSDDFKLFTLSDHFKGNISTFVPLKSLFGNYLITPTSTTLLNQKIGNVETNYPLISYSDFNNHKQAVIAGEGLWKWRLMEYAEFENHDISSELLIKSIQYLTSKEDKRPFRVYTNKKSYKENESISFDAQLYNASFESVNDPEAYLVITDQEGKNYDFTFSKSNNYYVLDAGRFPEGNYNYTATTNYNGKKLSASGKFNIQSVLKEKFDLTAKHDMLYQLSRKFNGEVVYPAEFSKLESLIRNDESIKPILYQKTETESLLNLKWLLGLFILLLSIEWFFRRYFGSY
ncbi:MAG: hypothetical protein HKO89_03405 [Saprospiraceae bacterium]|nr:hypothetical protein [Saprospiraceae bacterium]